MAGFELVGVPAGIQQLDAAARQLAQAGLDVSRHRYHLPGDCVAIFQAGGADFPVGDTEPLGHLARKIGGSHVALLDPEIKKIAAAAGLIRGDLFDLEVFRD